MKSLVLLISCITLLGWVGVSNAEEATTNFEWIKYTDTATGFQLYRDSIETPVGELIPVEDTTVSTTYELDGKCHNYWLRAVLIKTYGAPPPSTTTSYSANSNIAVVCPPGVDPPPPQQPPVSVGGFTVTTTTTITPTP